MLSKIFLYDNADWANFKSNLELFEIENLESISVNLLNRIISNKIDKVRKDCIPTASFNNANREPLPLNILTIIRQSNKLEIKYKKNRPEENKSIYYEAIESVKTAIENFKSKKWNDFVASLGPCPLSTKPYWQRINRIRKKKVTRGIPYINLDSKVLSTDEEKAKAFSAKLRNTFSEDQSYSNSFNEEHKSFVDN